MIHFIQRSKVNPTNNAEAVRDTNLQYLAKETNLKMIDSEASDQETGVTVTTNDGEDRVH